MNAQEQHTKKIGLNREPRFIRLGLDSRPKHGQSSLSARFIRNAAYTPGWYIVRRRSKFFEFHGTCANCSINVPITGSLLFPRTTARARARAPRFPLFLRRCFLHAPPRPFHPAPRRWNRRATVYLNFRSKGNTRRMPRPRWTRSRLDEEDTGHPVNGNPRLRYS